MTMKHHQNLSKSYPLGPRRFYCLFLPWRSKASALSSSAARSTSWHGQVSGKDQYGPTQAVFGRHKKYLTFFLTRSYNPSMSWSADQTVFTLYLICHMSFSFGQKLWKPFAQQESELCGCKSEYLSIFTNIPGSASSVICQYLLQAIPLSCTHSGPASSLRKVAARSCWAAPDNSNIYPLQIRTIRQWTRATLTHNCYMVNHAMCNECIGKDVWKKWRPLERDANAKMEMTKIKLFFPFGSFGSFGSLQFPSVLLTLTCQNVGACIAQRFKHAHVALATREPATHLQLHMDDFIRLHCSFQLSCWWKQWETPKSRERRCRCKGKKCLEETIGYWPRCSKTFMTFGSLPWLPVTSVRHRTHRMPLRCADSADPILCLRDLRVQH